MLWSSNRAVPARPRRRGPRRRARVRGADLAVELREQVGIGLSSWIFSPVDELPRAREAEERGDVEVDQCQFAVVKHGIFRGRRRLSSARAPRIDSFCTPRDSAP